MYTFNDKKGTVEITVEECPDGAETEIEAYQNGDRMLHALPNAAFDLMIDIYFVPNKIIY